METGMNILDVLQLILEGSSGSVLELSFGPVSRKRKAGDDATPAVPPKRPRLDLAIGPALNLESHQRRGKRKADDAELPNQPVAKKFRSAEPSSDPKDEVDDKQTHERLLMAALKRVAKAGDMKDFVLKYQQQEKLGKGGSATVFAGVRISDQQPVAIKHMSKHVAPLVPVTIEKQEYKIPLEVLLMIKASPDPEAISRHPTVSFLDWFVVDQHKILLVMERPTPAQDLYRYTLENALMQEEQAKVLLKQTVNALLDLHAKGVCHGDIKLDNLLMQMTDSGPRIRLIDFGCGAEVKQEETLTLAPPWFLVTQNRCNVSSVSQVGQVVYDLLFYRSGFTVKQLKTKVVSAPSTVSQECFDFLKSCFAKPGKPLDLLSQHRWLQ